VRSDPGGELERRALAGGDQRQHRVRGGRGPKRDRAGGFEIAQRAKQTRVHRLEAVRGPLVVQPTRPQRGGRRVLTVLFQPGRVAAVAFAAHVAHEREEALPHLRQRELVGEDRRHADRHRRLRPAADSLLQHPHQRHV
jgi:hypothetical protein